MKFHAYKGLKRDLLITGVLILLLVLMNKVF